MNQFLKQVARVAAVAAFTAATAGTAFSDDTEIFTGGVALSGSGLVKPNVLFIIDTSGSMNDPGEAAPPYDPNTTYAGDCAADRVYFTHNETDPSDDDNVPDCSDLDSDEGWLPKSWFVCNAAQTPLYGTSAGTPGYYVVNPDDEVVAQWRRSSSSATLNWRLLNPGDSYSESSNNADGSHRWVECKSDYGHHGDGVNTTKLWPKNNTSSSGAGSLIGPWAASASGTINWGSSTIDDEYIFWSANYLNYYADPGSVAKTKLEVVKEAATALITQLAVSNEVNVGLMRYSANESGFGGCTDTRAQGGMVVVPMGEVATNETSMVDAIDDLPANGCTPLSETLWEAYRYMSGGAVDYGLTSESSPGTDLPSVAGSRQDAPNTGLYKSPMLESCQNNFIVFLTDGLPTADTDAETKIETLIGAQCDDNPDDTSDADGRCLDDLAEYMRDNDLRSSVPDTQAIKTYFIGFGSDVVDAGSLLLAEAGTAGGGGYYTAESSINLVNAFNAILLDTMTKEPTSFTAPAVSINAFNRTQNLNDLYVSIFKPENQYVWPGNLKKYRLDPDSGEIVDAASPTPQEAVNASTGFFKDTAISYWSDAVDGADVEKGGAAHEQPLPADRKLYTNVNTGTVPGLATATGSPAAVTNSVENGNALITNVMLGLAAGDAAADRTKLINWLRGADVDGADATVARKQMADPLHGRPATVIYGGTVASPDVDDGIIYSVTNAGYLHAIKIADGSELWSFMPLELLAEAHTLYSTTESTFNKSYGLDGDVKVFREDVDSNGIIEPADGDKVYLFFGMGRGGSSYYALDVTNKAAPVFLWKIGPSEASTKQLPGAGQSWSSPSLARIQVGDGTGQNSMKLVLVFGGGYDAGQDTAEGAWVTSDASGNQVFIVDAVTGNRLWYASNSDSADLDLDAMNHAIPGDVRVVDLTGDGLADRMYAADMGGRVWRFDIFNGEDADDLVAGGVFASLGNAHLPASPAPPTSSARRFYNAPDVALLSSGRNTWINVAIGSGYRGHPLNLAIDDRFYSLRDHMPLRRLTQTEYDDEDVFETITEGDLTDITSFVDDAPAAVANDSKGWYLQMVASGGTGSGEKVLAEARTIANMIQFPSYQPPSEGDVADLDVCSAPPYGKNRLYTVSAFNGAPVIEQDGEEGLTEGDRTKELAQSGIAPEVVWLFPSPENPEECTGDACHPPPRCLVGIEQCGVDINLGPVRTYWKQNSVR